MIGSQCRQASPTKLSLQQFEQFVLPDLSQGRRGSAPTLAWYTLANYVLQMLYTGCQWKALAIKMNARGLPEIHYTLARTNSAKHRTVIGLDFVGTHWNIWDGAGIEKFLLSLY
jgi:hypothetical protein